MATVNGLLGRKVGMTQVFTAEGKVVPVTVIEVGPCAVVQRKTEEKEGGREEMGGESGGENWELEGLAEGDRDQERGD